MEPITVIPRTVADMEREPNLAALFVEYAQESATPELGTADVQLAMYRNMEAAGALRLLGAYQGDTLVGFLVLIVSVVPHFGKCIASTESYFVTQWARGGGAGIKLLRAAEEVARESGAVALFVSSPSAGRLARVMPRMGYRETNRVYMRGLA